LNFQWQESLQIQYLPHSQSKSYQIDSIKSCSSRSFQQHQRHIPIPLKLSATILIYFFSEEIIQCSRTTTQQVEMAWNQTDASLLLKSFPNRPRTQSEASQFGGSHKYKTKQTNYLHR
jgi:hypothetical protein